MHKWQNRVLVTPRTHHWPELVYNKNHDAFFHTCHDNAQCVVALGDRLELAPKWVINVVVPADKALHTCITCRDLLVVVAWTRHLNQSYQQENATYPVWPSSMSRKSSSSGSPSATRTVSSQLLECRCSVPRCSKQQTQKYLPSTWTGEDAGDSHSAFHVAGCFCLRRSRKVCDFCLRERP